MSDFAVSLGAEVTDKVTEFGGTVTGRAEYSSGCRQYLVTPKAKERGEFPKAIWLDEDRVVETAEAEASPPGGPQQSPPPVA